MEMAAQCALQMSPTETATVIEVLSSFYALTDLSTASLVASLESTVDISGLSVQSVRLHSQPVSTEALWMSITLMVTLFF